MQKCKYKKISKKENYLADKLSKEAVEFDDYAYNIHTDFRTH